MSQNVQTHFKNLAAFAASVSDHFGTLCIKRLNGAEPLLEPASSLNNFLKGVFDTFILFYFSLNLAYSSITKGMCWV